MLLSEVSHTIKKRFAYLADYAPDNSLKTSVMSRSLSHFHYIVMCSVSAVIASGLVERT